MDIIINKNYAGIKKVDGHYEFTGDILCDGNIKIELDLWLLVTGSIKAGGSIRSGEYIEVTGFIEAGGFIKVTGSIRTGGFIRAGELIEAGGSIEVGGFIDAGGSIESGESYGISAGQSITAKLNISCGQKIFAGICVGQTVADIDKTITCAKLESGTVEYGILREIGVAEKKKVTLELTDKQLDKIQKILTESEG